MALRFQQKLTIPVASRPLVSREGLVARLDDAVTMRRLVVLAAPAGWGKSTLLAQWAASAPLPVAWYTLDAADHDPHRFLDYLLHTVAPFVPSAHELAARIDSTLPQSIAEVAHEAALLIADAPNPFALVLDDLQLLTEGPSLPGSALVIDLLASLVEYAANCHLVLASRTVPELRGMVRLIAQQRAAVFDYGLLQFSVAEVQQLAALSGGAQLANEQADQLAAQFGGWVTGIVLSLDRSIQHRYQPSFDGVSNTGQVYAYFAEQVIAPLPPDVQRFLEETSLLEDLAPERCDRLRGEGDSAHYLDLVLRQSLFVTVRGGWLTYHSLFRDFLRARLLRDVERARRLLLRASELYHEEDDLERALECLLVAKAEEQALALLREAAPRLRQRSLHTTIIACFQQLGQRLLLPADLLIEQARVYSDLALWDEAFAAIELAEATGDQSIKQIAQITHADMYSLRGNLQEAQRRLDKVRVAELPPAAQTSYAIVASRLQSARGEVASAITMLEGALRLIPPGTDPQSLRTVGIVSDLLGLAYARQGERTVAQGHLRRADACWQMLGNKGQRAMTLNNLGMLALEERRTAEARRAFEQGLENARQTARRRSEMTLLCSLGELELYEGNIAVAIERFAEAHALALRLYVAGIALIAGVSAWWAAVLLGDGSLARQWEVAARLAGRNAPPDVRGRATLAHSRAHRLGFATEPINTAQALAALEPYQQQLPPVDQAELALQQAALAYEQGDSSADGRWQEAQALLVGLPSPLCQHLLAPYQQLGRHPNRLAVPTPDSWIVAALGMFTCTHNGSPCELSPIYQALLARLLDAGPGGLAVERLWEAVWGDSELSMTALHQALRRLRAQTGLAVSARDGLCAIRTPWEAVSYDVRSFEEALGTAHSLETLERAVALYRGEFLPSAPLSAALWMGARRDHLQQRFLDALEQLGQRYEAQSPQVAIHHYQRVLQIDGCREQTAARLMQLAAQMGNRSLVNTTYEHLTLALRTLGVAPSESTRVLFRRLV